MNFKNLSIVVFSMLFIVISCLSGSDFISIKEANDLASKLADKKRKEFSILLETAKNGSALVQF